MDSNTYFWQPFLLLYFTPVYSLFFLTLVFYSWIFSLFFMFFEILILMLIIPLWSYINRVNHCISHHNYPQTHLPLQLVYNTFTFSCMLHNFSSLSLSAGWLTGYISFSPCFEVFTHCYCPKVLLTSNMPPCPPTHN